MKEIFQVKEANRPLTVKKLSVDTTEGEMT